MMMRKTLQELRYKCGRHDTDSAIPDIVELANGLVLYQRIGYFQLDWPVSSQIRQFDDVFMKLMILVIIVFGVLVV
jgi:hypothetical protein